MSRPRLVLTSLEFPFRSIIQFVHCIYSPKPCARSKSELIPTCNMDAAILDHGESKKVTVFLTDLPDEVLQQILSYCPPRDVLHNVQRLSKRFNELASEPLLWKHHCRVDFAYWDAKHHIQPKFMGGIGDADWKRIYTNRIKVDVGTTAHLDSILESQTDRISRFKSIADYGYDAKDALLRHCHVSDGAEDVLARRYVKLRLHCKSKGLNSIQVLCKLCSRPFAPIKSFGRVEEGHEGRKCYSRTSIGLL